VGGLHLENLFLATVDSAIQNLIKAFKFRAQAIFSFLEKTHPPGLQNLSSRFFSYYSTLQVPKETIHIKNWILIAVLRN
jgi:hypothetical protein